MNRFNAARLAGLGRAVGLVAEQALDAAEAPTGPSRDAEHGIAQVLGQDRADRSSQVDERGPRPVDAIAPTSICPSAPMLNLPDESGTVNASATKVSGIHFNSV